MIDPTDASHIASEANVFPCRQCGARLTFAPGTDVIRCGHCGTENKIEVNLDPIEEMDFRAALRQLAGGQDKDAIEETRTITCESCSAEFTFDPHVRAEGCPYCGGAIVNEPRSHRVLRPRALVPFQVPSADARERLKGWLGSLWFAPSGVKEYAQQQDKLTGVYVPYWTFDAETQSTYFGERGIAHQVPRTIINRIQGRAVRKTQYVTEMRWTPVRGRVGRFFDDVLVLASRTLPDHVVEKLGSWRLDALKPYQDAYLSGFRSEAYQVDLEDGFAQAKQIMDRQIRSDVAFDIGGHAQRIHQVDTRFGTISFKHILLPIWSAAYRYNGKTYRFVVNGQTGEVQGERPYSAWKIALAVLVGLIVAGAFAYVAATMQ